MSTRLPSSKIVVPASSMYVETAELVIAGTDTPTTPASILGFRDTSPLFCSPWAGEQNGTTSRAYIYRLGEFFSSTTVAGWLLERCRNKLRSP